MYIGYFVGLFRSLAGSAGIELNYIMSKRDFIRDYDPDKLLQIVSNELQVQLRALIAQRKKLQERYSVVGNLILSEEHEYKAEDKFIKRIRQIMDEKLADENFNIHELCLAAGMSRTQLYRKFRQLTDRTPSNYFRTFRLYKAQELLTGSDIAVSEAAYKTGFRNISHFSRVFKKEFGINPSEARYQ